MGRLLLVCLASAALLSACTTTSNDAGDPDSSMRGRHVPIPSPTPTEKFLRGTPAPLEASDKLAVEKYGAWLDGFEAVSFDTEYEPSLGALVVEPLEGLAESYPGQSESISDSLQVVSDSISNGYDYLDDGTDKHQQAADILDSAAADLVSTTKVILKEAENLELSTGYRLGGTRVQDETTTANSTTVLRWIDGDTVLTSQGIVRVVGIDTPELSERCSKAFEAVDAVEEFAPAGTNVKLVNPESVDDTDKYDRLLRYVTLSDGTDVGYSLLLNGLATARYDSRDGYDWHPRELAYREDAVGVEDQSFCGWGLAAAVGLALAADDKDDDNGDHHRLLLLDGFTHVFDDSHENFSSTVTRATKVRAAEEKEKVAAAEREAERKRRAAKESSSSSSSSTSKSSSPSKSESQSSDSGGQDLSGYTGCRAYAPGGKTWKPIPCP